MDKDGFMQCPICLKKFQRLKPHLRSKKECSSIIDFTAFCESFELFDTNMKKAKKREATKGERQSNKIWEHLKKSKEK